MFQNGRLRALTPLEWERAQGFPDDWTASMPERERYLAMGDAMNVDTARWVGHRIQVVDKAIPLITAPENTYWQREAALAGTGAAS